MKFLKQALKTPDKSLKFLLHRHLTTTQPGRSYKTLHASSLTKEDPEFCPRENALAVLLGIKPHPETLIASQEAVFTLGRIWQDQIVNWLGDMGRAVGDWKCLACGARQEFCKRPVKCPHCGCRAFKPEEFRFRSEICGASCGIDTLLDIGEPRHVVVEIKTMRPEEFKTLVAPLAEHRYRTNLYLRLVAESDSPFKDRVNTARAKILYTSKGGFGNADPELETWGLPDKFSPFKEFEIQRDDAMTDGIVARAKMFWDFRTGKAGLPLGLCPTALCKRAKVCPVMKSCFSGQFPAGMMAQIKDEAA